LVISQESLKFIPVRLTRYQRTKPRHVRTIGKKL